MQSAYIPPSQVASIAKTEQAQRYGDTPIRVVQTGRVRLGVFEVYRSSVHERGDDVEEPLVMHVGVIYQIVRGSGMLVTGGTLIGAHPIARGDSDAALIGSHTLRGTGIRAGTVRRVRTGDIVIVPAGVPHGFREIPHSITYLSIRVDPLSELPLK